MADPFLAADVRVRRGEVVVTAGLTARRGEVVAVVGPNGAGKSTLLGALAGTLASGGPIVVDGRHWEGLPGHRRRVGLVHQDHSLFPHLTALANVAYGPRARGTPRTEARRGAQALLDRFGVGELAARRPGQLSGGQSQRVALARALATDPQVLLLDEPFAALDVAVAQRLRTELGTHLRDFAGVSLLVTHDAVDLFTLADRLLVLEDGRVVQTGTPDEVAARPATAHAARLVGRNVLTGRADGTRVHLDSGAELVLAAAASGPVLVTFSPSAVTLTLAEPHGSARNRWRCVVRHLVPTGEVVRVHLDAPGLLADVTAEAVADLGLRVGSSVWASVKATDTTVVAPAVQVLGSGHE